MTPWVLATIAGVVGTFIGLLARRHVVFLTRVQSHSMSPTLRPGQWLMTRPVRGADRIARGDIVVVKSAFLGRVIIKRVIGLAGNRVVVNADGSIRIDDVPLREPYVALPAGPARSFEVPPGHLLLLGDNRTASSDSRSWEEPFVPMSAVLGKIVIGLRGRVPRTQWRSGSSGTGGQSRTAY